MQYFCEALREVEAVSKEMKRFCTQDLYILLQGNITQKLKDLFPHTSSVPFVSFRRAQQKIVLYAVVSNPLQGAFA